MKKRYKPKFKPNKPQLITVEFLTLRAEHCMKAGFPKQKWVEFCECMLIKGYQLEIYEAIRTVSKYITVKKGKLKFKVRFSNHKPIQYRELKGDCDFFVGVTNLKTTTTRMAIAAVDEFFSKKDLTNGN